MSIDIHMLVCTYIHACIRTVVQASDKVSGDRERLRPGHLGSKIVQMVV